MGGVEVDNESGYDRVEVDFERTGGVSAKGVTSVYVERYKDGCKTRSRRACPEILKISGFMNGINNPELIKKLNDRAQTFDELMKRTRSFLSRRKPPPEHRKGYIKQQHENRNKPGRQSNDQKQSQQRPTGEGSITTRMVQLRQLIDKLGKEARLRSLVKNIKEGKDKQRAEAKKTHRRQADTSIMEQSWQQEN
ncbi:hypothetical protein Tco_1459044 [Tanacetum coccineum]